jgi:hypothetical protein
MFLVSDTLIERQKKIRSFLPNDPAIAVLLAAADFEWTARRAILALGKSPTKEIHERMDKERKGGLESLQNYWKIEVKPLFGKDLAAMIKDWEFFRNTAYKLRNKLIHGATGSTSVQYATRAVESFLAASKVVADFAEEKGEPIYGRRIRRTKAR